MTGKLNAMRELLGGGADDIATAAGADALTIMAAMGDTMAIAEEVIAKATSRMPMSRAQVVGSKAFGIMCPPPLLRGKSDDVYRAHARELMRRVVKGEDTRPATKAEILCALSGASLIAPLSTAGLALTDWLFRQVMPDSRLTGDAPVREVHEGQVAEDFAAGQRKYADQDRKTT